MNGHAIGTSALTQAGVSIWLDDLSRDRIDSGGLAALIEQRDVVGITTNPTIFANALASGTAYDARIRELADSGASVSEALVELTTTDVAHACDVFLPVFTATNGVDGRVSIEVSPGAAHDTAATLHEVENLRHRVNKPNVFVKIPATDSGIAAIEEATSRGISINVTLIFGLDRYQKVIDAYLRGLERADAAGIELGGIHSVASVFVSRVDAEVDKRLSALGTPQALALKGKAGIANARLAYELFERAFANERAADLLAKGANPQRPLWASTGVKDPSLPDTLYVVELVAPGVVNTMPEKTLEAVADHGIVRGNTIAGTYDVSRWVLDSIAELGISLEDVTSTLEREGIEKFDASYREAVERLQVAMQPVESQ